MTPRLSRRQLLGAPAALTGLATAHAQTPSTSPEASPVAAGPTIVVDPTRVRLDERFHLVASGFEPGEAITIEAKLRDDSLVIATTTATYTADQSGVIDPQIQAPIRGSFDVADTMGFVWSASSLYLFSAATGEEQVDFRVLRGDEFVAETTVTRTGLSDPYLHETVDGPDFVGEFYAPKVDTPLPAMIVLGGSEGGVPNAYDSTMFAARGYAALSVAYFRTGNLPDALENIPLEYFANAIAWLQVRPDVDSERIGVIGYSRGAELALLLGAHYPELGAVVSVSGSGLVFDGVDWNDFSRPSFPAWTWEGNPIPYVDETFDPQDPAMVDRVTIAAERTNGPVMMISGESDQLWASSTLSRFAWDRLQAADRTWPDEFLTYPSAGHYIQPPYLPMAFSREYSGFPVGGNARDDTLAGADSWQAILNMLAWRFGPHAGT